MCGIAGIAGTTEIAKRLYRSITYLEYRGYDSCGVAIIDRDNIHLRKNIGKIAEVNRKEQLDALPGHVGIAHTRWATHGGVTSENSHPHYSQDKKFALVHNGVIKNYDSLKKRLLAKGVTFRSQTDTEVIVMLLEYYFEQEGRDVEAALRRTFRELEGSFAIAVVTTHQPNTIFAAKQDMSPLLIGVGNGEMYLGSDVNAFIDDTKKMVPVKDGEMVMITPTDYVIKNSLTGEVLNRNIEIISWDRGMAQKGGFPHYMLKEIHDQPETTRTVLSISEAELLPLAREIGKRERIFLMGVGTTYYVALAAQYYFQKLTGKYVPAMYSDEFDQLVTATPRDLVVAISQSGETYDTLVGLRHARQGGAATAAILNAVGSSMSRQVEFPIHQGSGPEICVLSTKAATAQMLLLVRLALLVGRESGFLTAEKFRECETALDQLPALIQQVINSQAGRVNEIALKNSGVKNWLYIGRGLYHAMGLEASLKMKEVTYLHAEGLPGGFLKHGTIAMVDGTLRIVGFIPHPDETELHDAMMSNIEEVRARGGKIIAFHQDEANPRFDEQIILPASHPLTLPILELIAGQLLAYFTAVKLERDPDKPRNLAKSVTVP